MKLLKPRGATSQRVRFLVKSQSTGLGVAGLAYGTAGLSVYYHRSGDTSSTAVTLAAGTLGTFVNSSGTGTGGGFALVDDAHMPGLCELSMPDACWAAGDPIIQVNVPSGSFCEPLEYEMTGADLGAAPGSTNALLSYGSGAGQLLVSSGGLLSGDLTFAASPAPTATTATFQSSEPMAGTDKTGWRIVTTGGTGGGQRATILSYDISTFTASFAAVAVTFDDTTTYQLLEPVDAVDPWAVGLPGSYAAGEAGYILGHYLDTQVSSRSTYAGGMVAGVTAPVTLAAGSIATATFAAGATLPVVNLVNTLTTYTGDTPQTGDLFALLNPLVTSGAFTGAALANVPRSGYLLAAAGLDAVPVESGVNARQALSPILAAAAGVVSGAGTGLVTIKGGNVATTRIVSACDSSGNRTSVTLSIPS